MAYCAIGTMSTADWEEIKKLCSSMRNEMDSKLSALETKLEAEIASLDVNQIQVIKNRLLALESAVSAFDAGQAVQDSRLNDLEEKCANLEITTNEVIEAWQGQP